MNVDTGTVEPLWRSRLDTLRQAMMELGAEVFSAHHNEAWGAHWLAAEVCTPVDFAAMRRADAVCAVVGAPLSGGVAVELGWASALAKPTLVVLPPELPVSPLISGLGRVTRTRYLTEPPSWLPSELASIATAAVAMVTTAAPVPRVGEPQRDPDGRDQPLDSHVAFCSRLRCGHLPAGASRFACTDDPGG
jgi:hypothetical protein